MLSSAGAKVAGDRRHGCERASEQESKGEADVEAVDPDVGSEGSNVRHEERAHVVVLHHVVQLVLQRRARLRQPARDPLRPTIATLSASLLAVVTVGTLVCIAIIDRHRHHHHH
eukprot:397667-Rhodomonas_salina.2